VCKKITTDIVEQSFDNTLTATKQLKKKDTSFIPPKRGGLLRLSRAFSATLTGRFGMDTVRMGAGGRW
jgi:hypothetical protein